VPIAGCRLPIAGCRLSAAIGSAVVLSLAVACSPGPADRPVESKPEPRAPANAPSTSVESPASVGFARTLALQGITFRVSCPNRGSINTLQIEPEGLLADNSPMVQEVEGTVRGADVADLNGDGSPEVYVYVESAGSGSYGSLVAYSANNRKSLSGIYLPPLSDQGQAAKGYMGHDQFSIAGDRLVQRFPIYRDGDPNAAPTGGMRRIEYRLEAGEVGWVLRVAETADRPY
jgi:Periplasmic lysozyme inhibitor of I-type lysozyme